MPEQKLHSLSTGEKLELLCAYDNGQCNEWDKLSKWLLMIVKSPEVNG